MHLYHLYLTCSSRVRKDGGYQQHRRMRKGGYLFRTRKSDPSMEEEAGMDKRGSYLFRTRKGGSYLFRYDIGMTLKSRKKYRI